MFLKNLSPSLQCVHVKNTIKYIKLKIFIVEKGLKCENSIQLLKYFKKVINFPKFIAVLQKLYLHKIFIFDKNITQLQFIEKRELYC
jgi:hypothetical protein